MSASLFLFHRYIHLCCLSDPTFKVFVFLFLSLLSVIISRSIHVAANGFVSLFFMAQYYSICVCVCVHVHKRVHKCTRVNHIFFIHSSVNGHYIGVHVSFWIIVFFPDRCPRVGLQGHMATLVLVFRGTSTLFSIMAAPVYIPTSTPMLRKDSLFFIPSLTFVICRLFNDDHSDWCEGVPYCSFGLHFLIISGDEHLFHVLFDHLYVFFRKMSI